MIAILIMILILAFGIIFIIAGAEEDSSFVVAVGITFCVAGLLFIGAFIGNKVEETGHQQIKADKVKVIYKDNTVDSIVIYRKEASE